jgi:hypothetical protein
VAHHGVVLLLFNKPDCDCDRSEQEYRYEKITTDAFWG